MTTIDDGVYSLKQAMELASQAVRQALPSRFWLLAEIADISVKGGHTYIDLVQKEHGAVVAKTKAAIWQRDARAILGRFREATGRSLAVGMGALMCVTAGLHVVYGFSFTVHAIDADHTIGEMARQKREAIDRLTREGLMERNKQLAMPLAPLRIAVISSKSAAGYEDFVDQIERNPRGYAFAVTLFEAVMQGDQAERSLHAALAKAASESARFDVLALIRGGGSKIDLNCFDGYPVARDLAVFPIPVITGIGHERDDSVADMVAHTRCKTPTAVAEFLIGRVAEFEDALLDLQARLTRLARSGLESAAAEIDRCARRLQAGVIQIVSRRAQELRVGEENLRTGLRVRLEREKGALDRLADKTGLLDPINVLRRGYSLVYAGEALIRGISQARIGQDLTVRLADGSLETEVSGIVAAKESAEDEI
jgi:exodeoxyribonuclease VII large subunit